MDAATLQQRINTGFAKAAQRIGFDFDIFRPSVPPYSPPTPRYPLSPLNKVTTLKAAFAVKGDKTFTRGGAYKDFLFETYIDGSRIQTGDYLFNAAHGTYFIASKRDLAPILSVKCSHALDVARATMADTFGKQGYSGNSPATEAIILKAWPGAVLYTQRGRVHDVGLPMDLPSPFYELYLPYFPGVQLRPGDVVVDDNGQRFDLAVAELSDLGWRLSAQLAVT